MIKASVKWERKSVNKLNTADVFIQLFTEDPPAQFIFAI